MNKINIRRAKEKDLIEIRKLQEKHHYKNVSEKEKLKEGFVSVKTSISLLKEINKEGIFVAEKDNKLLGYVFPLTLKHTKKISLLGPFIKRFSKIKYKNKKLSDYKWIIAGQILVDKEYKGKGIVEELWKSFIKLMRKKYELIISEVSSQNPRSLHVSTTKLNLEILKKYYAEGRNWYIVVYDLKT